MHTKAGHVCGGGKCCTASPAPPICQPTLVGRCAAPGSVPAATIILLPPQQSWEQPERISLVCRAVNASPPISLTPPDRDQHQAVPTLPPSAVHNLTSLLTQLSHLEPPQLQAALQQQHTLTLSHSTINSVQHSTQQSSDDGGLLQAWLMFLGRVNQARLPLGPHLASWLCQSVSDLTCLPNTRNPPANNISQDQARHARLLLELLINVLQLQTNTPAQAVHKRRRKAAASATNYQPLWNQRQNSHQATWETQQPINHNLVAAAHQGLHEHSIPRTPRTTAHVNSWHPHAPPIPPRHAAASFADDSTTPFIDAAIQHLLQAVQPCLGDTCIWDNAQHVALMRALALCQVPTPLPEQFQSALYTWLAGTGTQGTPQQPPQHHHQHAQITPESAHVSLQGLPPPSSSIGPISLSDPYRSHPIDIHMVPGSIAATVNGHTHPPQHHHQHPVNGHTVRPPSGAMLRMSTDFIQQAMWAISRMVTRRMAAPHGPYLMQVLHTRMSDEFKTSASNPHQQSHVLKAAAACCVSNAHIIQHHTIALEGQGVALTSMYWAQRLCQAVQEVSPLVSSPLHASLQAEVLWACARVGFRPSTVFLRDVVHTLHGAASVPPDKLVQACWALAALYSGSGTLHPHTHSQPHPPHHDMTHPHPHPVQGATATNDPITPTLVLQLMHQLMARLYPTLDRLTAPSLATLLWSLAQASLTASSTAATSQTRHTFTQQHHTFFNQLLTTIAPLAPALSPHLAITVLWSCSALGFQIRPGTPHAHSPPPSSSSQSNTRDPIRWRGHVSHERVAGGAGHVDSVPSRLVHQCVTAMAQRALQGLGSVSGDDVAKLMVSLWRLGWRAEASWSAQVVEGIRSHLPTLDLHRLSQLLFGCYHVFTPATSRDHDTPLQHHVHQQHTDNHRHTDNNTAALLSSASASATSAAAGQSKQTEAQLWYSFITSASHALVHICHHPSNESTNYTGGDGDGGGTSSQPLQLTLEQDSLDQDADGDGVSLKTQWFAQGVIALAGLTDRCLPQHYISPVSGPISSRHYTDEQVSSSASSWQVTVCTDLQPSVDQLTSIWCDLCERQRADSTAGGTSVLSCVQLLRALPPLLHLHHTTQHMLAQASAHPPHGYAPTTHQGTDSHHLAGAGVRCTPQPAPPTQPVLLLPPIAPRDLLTRPTRTHPLDVTSHPLHTSTDAAHSHHQQMQSTTTGTQQGHALGHTAHQGHTSHSIQGLIQCSSSVHILAPWMVEAMSTLTTTTPPPPPPTTTTTTTPTTTTQRLHQAVMLLTQRLIPVIGSLPAGGAGAWQLPASLAALLQAYVVLGVSPKPQLYTAMHQQLTTSLHLLASDPVACAGMLHALSATTQGQVLSKVDHHTSTFSAAAQQLAGLLQQALDPSHHSTPLSAHVTSHNTGSDTNQQGNTPVSPATHTHVAQGHVRGSDPRFRSGSRSQGRDVDGRGGGRMAVAVLMRRLPELSPGDVCYVLHGLARHGWRVDKTFSNAVTKQVMNWHQLDSWSILTAQDCARLLWAIAKLGIHLPPTAMSHLDRQLTHLLPQLDTDSNISVQQLQPTGFSDPRTLMQMLWVVAKRCSGVRPALLNHDSGSLDVMIDSHVPDVQQPSRSQTSSPVPAWCEGVSQHLEPYCDHLPLDDLCVVLWASTTILKARPCPLSPHPSEQGHAGSGSTSTHTQLLLPHTIVLYHTCNRILDSRLATHMQRKSPQHQQQQHQHQHQQQRGSVPSTSPAQDTTNTNTPTLDTNTNTINTGSLTSRIVASSPAVAVGLSDGNGSDEVTDVVEVVDGLTPTTTGTDTGTGTDSAAVPVVSFTALLTALEARASIQDVNVDWPERPEPPGTTASPTGYVSHTARRVRRAHGLRYNSHRPGVGTDLLWALSAGLKTAPVSAVLSLMQLLNKSGIKPPRFLTIRLLYRLRMLLVPTAPTTSTTTATVHTAVTGQPPLSGGMLVSVVIQLGRLRVLLPVGTEVLVLRGLVAALPRLGAGVLVQVLQALVALETRVDGEPAAMVLQSVARLLKTHEFDGQGVCQVLLCLAHLACPSNTRDGSAPQWRPAAPLLDDCCALLATRVEGTRCQDVADAIWALAKLEYRPSASFMAEMLPHALQLGTTQSCRLRPLATLIYSLAALSFRPPPTWLVSLYDLTNQKVVALADDSARAMRKHSRASDDIVSQRGDAASRELAFCVPRMMWAVATLKSEPGREWLSSCVRAVGPVLCLCTAHELTLLAVGAALLGPPLDASWLMTFQEAAESKAVREDTQAQDRLAWAWGQMQGRVALDQQVAEKAHGKTSHGRHGRMMRLTVIVKQSRVDIRQWVKRQHYMRYIQGRLHHVEGGEMMNRLV